MLKSSGAQVFKFYYCDSRLLKKWSGLNAPIVFDFGVDDLWVIGLSMERSALMYTLKRSELIEQFKQGIRQPPVKTIAPKYQRSFRRRRVRRRF